MIRVLNEIGGSGERGVAPGAAANLESKDLPEESKRTPSSLGASCGGSVVKKMPANAGGLGSIPQSGRVPGEGNGNPLQYCLANPMDRGAWQAYSPAGVTRVRHDLAINNKAF